MGTPIPIPAMQRQRASMWFAMVHAPLSVIPTMIALSRNIAPRTQATAMEPASVNKKQTFYARKFSSQFVDVMETPMAMNARLDKTLSTLLMMVFAALSAIQMQIALPRIIATRPKATAMATESANQGQ